jgi:PPM family protein phosphatase
MTPCESDLESLPPSATVDVTFGAESRRGRFRTVNEDHYTILRLGRHQETIKTSLPEDMMARRFDEYGYAMVVADGMGGVGAGEVASRIALITLTYLVRTFGKWNLRVDDTVAREIMARAERFYRFVDGTVMAERRASAPRTLRTTLTAIFGAGHDLFFAHVGHSRAYLLRSGKLIRLTRDHTIGEQRAASAASPLLVDVNAGGRDLAHILTDTVGMGGSLGPTIDIERLRLEDNDRVLVCTNGLTDIVVEEQIADVLASAHSPDDMCQMLIDLAMTAGGEDDVTALVARYRIPEG